MNKLTNTIKFKIILALGACIVLMIAIGLMGVRGLATMSSDMSAMYTDSTVPIEDLAATQAYALKIRILLSRLQAMHDPNEAKQAAEQIRDLQKNSTPRGSTTTQRKSPTTTSANSPTRSRHNTPTSNR
jgi:hypothetical protein